jgi:SAM-dependent methyltransferase
MTEAGHPAVNLWASPEHARDFLERRRTATPQLDPGYSALLEWLPESPRRVLDLGTGDGHLAAQIRDLRPDATYVVCDFSTEMLARAAQRFADAPEVTVVEHDLEDPLPDSWGTFDLVVSALAIHHVPDERKRDLYAEIFERLEPGGVFRNFEVVASATPALHESFLRALGRTSEEDDPSDKLALVETQIEWLRSLGFADVDCFWKWREFAVFGGTKRA